ncbi:MAG: SDR family oxidoreductase [Paludibacteraceae bacterium]|nr:SDR family oxidoreductase [Paludibacteraceae bacterium]
MRKTIFLTGSTGLLGSYLLNQLLYNDIGTDVEIVALCRGKTQKIAQKRVFDTLRKIPSTKSAHKASSVLTVVRGDITKKKLGLSEKVYNNLIERVNLVYHSAALAEFNIPLPIIRKANVMGTRNVLEFALACQKKNDFKRVHYISTVAVAGDRNGTFRENQLNIGQKFNNTYERTKFEAEKLIATYRDRGLSITVYRPAIIVGDSKTGYTNNLKMFYQPLHLFSLGLFKEIPADKNTIYSFVPADYAADAIIRISSSDNIDRSSTYHIANPNMVGFDYVMDTASRYFGFRQPNFIKNREFCVKSFTPLQHSLLDPFIPYFYYKMRFNTENANNILKKTNFKWPKIDESFLKKLYKFCVVCGFIKAKNKK